MKSVPSAAHIKNHYSLQPSTITGSDQDKVWAEKTRTAWINYGLPSVSIATYWPLLTIPQYQSLTLVDGTKLAPISQAYAGTGNVTGPIVYVNYGRLSDFQFLQTRNTLFNGTIALMRQERDTIKPGTQIKLAQEFGCLGAILYQDPADNPW
jgi:N-acetylated-alpha-linked acidic dipeptidase